jgi:hypothetical protein
VRYEVREDIKKTWKIIDTVSSLPAATNGRDLVQLARKDAIDLMRDLNECEERGRGR